MAIVIIQSNKMLSMVKAKKDKNVYNGCRCRNKKVLVYELSPAWAFVQHCGE